MGFTRIILLLGKIQQGRFLEYISIGSILASESYRKKSVSGLEYSSTPGPRYRRHRYRRFATADEIFCALKDSLAPNFSLPPIFLRKIREILGLKWPKMNFEIDLGLVKNKNE